jgi:hypothetical protein
MREWLPTSIFTREAVSAYVSSSIRLVEINVPFVGRTEARKATSTKEVAGSSRCV